MGTPVVAVSAQFETRPDSTPECPDCGSRMTFQQGDVGDIYNEPIPEGHVCYECDRLWSYDEFDWS